MLRKSKERGGGQGGQRSRASKGNSGAQKGSQHSRDKDDNLQRSKEGSQKRRAIRKHGTHNSKQKDRETSSANPRTLAKDKRNYFNEKRNDEYRVLYDDSDDEIPSWDTRVRAVKRRQAELRTQKRMDVIKQEQEAEEAKRKAYECDDESDSDYDKGKRDSPNSWTRDNEHTQLDSKHRGKALSNTEDDTNADSLDQKECPHCLEKDETDEDGWFWDWGEKKITTRFKSKRDDGEDETTTQKDRKFNPGCFEQGSKAHRNNDVLSDEDTWFWDSIDSNLRRNRSTRNKSRQPAKKTRRKKLHRSLHADLQYKLESEQLQNYKTAFYENLRNQARSSTSSSKSSSSSSSTNGSNCRKGNETSDDEDRTRTIEDTRRGRKGVVYSCLDDSSSSTDRTARTKDRRHRWNTSEDAKDGSMTSESTSSIDSEDHSSS